MILDFQKPFRALNSEEVGSHNNMLARSGDTWHTEGSKTKDESGAGVYNIRECESINLGSLATVLQAEVVAITVYVKTMMRKAYNNKRIRIMTESQAALRALESTPIRSKVVNECLNALRTLGVHNRVIPKLFRGHQETDGNKRADLLAKRRAKEALVGPQPTCGVEYQYTKKRTSTLLDGLPRTTTIMFVHGEFVPSTEYYRASTIKWTSFKNSNWTAYETLLFKEIFIKDWYSK